MTAPQIPRESRLPQKKHWWKLLALIAIPLLAFYAFLKVTSPELSSMPTSDLGFALAQPSQDSGDTGFMIAGTNSTETIRSLKSLNGVPMKELEARMRPAAPYPNMGSTSGFIGHNEKLLEIIAEDNRLVVDEWQLSHQEFAEPLLMMGYYAQKHADSVSKSVHWKGRLFDVYAKQYKGFQYSPFGDDTRSNSDITVKNRLTGEVLEYSLLVPHLIHRYGFYEGKGTPYRVDPHAIRSLLELN